MPKQMTRHVVVDGSNLATEGRPYPSLKQLNEAVLAYLEDNPTDVITVVVDATFGHRIDPAEVDEFDDAVDNNELVAPPAGAIGRGDAFVLTIANKADATILSNDSFQEFHGDHPWLFDEGRLVGGKPVPNVGWVFVPRTPVRGPVSRRAQRDARQHGRTARAGELRKGPGRPSKLASEPLPTPKKPPPGATRRLEVVPPPPSSEEAAAEAAAVAAARPLPGRNEPINELVGFLEFVERHPVGSPIVAEVEQFSSHGAYLDADGIRAYIPLRLMGEPAPRSARSVLAQGERREFVVVSYNAARRGIDVALPEAVPAEVEVRDEPDQPEALPAEVVAVATEADRPTRRRGRRRAAEPDVDADVDADVEADADATGPEVAVTPDVEDAGNAEAEAPPPRRRSRRRTPDADAAAAADVAPELAGVEADAAGPAPRRRGRRSAAVAPPEVTATGAGSDEILADAQPEVAASEPAVAPDRGAAPGEAAPELVAAGTDAEVPPAKDAQRSESALAVPDADGESPPSEPAVALDRGAASAPAEVAPELASEARPEPAAAAAARPARRRSRRAAPVAEPETAPAAAGDRAGMPATDGAAEPGTAPAAADDPDGTPATDGAAAPVTAPASTDDREGTSATVDAAAPETAPASTDDREGTSATDSAAAPETAPAAAGDRDGTPATDGAAEPATAAVDDAQVTSSVHTAVEAPPETEVPLPLEDVGGEPMPDVAAPEPRPPARARAARARRTAEPEPAEPAAKPAKKRARPAPAPAAAAAAAAKAAADPAPDAEAPPAKKRAPAKRAAKKAAATPEPAPARKRAPRTRAASPEEVGNAGDR